MGRGSLARCRRGALGLVSWVTLGCLIDCMGGHLDLVGVTVWYSRRQSSSMECWMASSRFVLCSLMEGTLSLFTDNSEPFRCSWTMEEACSRGENSECWTLLRALSKIEIKLDINNNHTYRRWILLFPLSLLQSISRSTCCCPSRCLCTNRTIASSVPPKSSLYVYMTLGTVICP